MTGEHFAAGFDHCIGIVHCDGDLPVANNDEVERSEFFLESDVSSSKYSG